jgi:uncharacterized SAM-binding protein YcdF (DUF218 family)
MRATLTEAFHMLLQVPVWVSLALAWAAFHAWQAPQGTRWSRWRVAWSALAVFFYVLNVPVLPTLMENRLERLYSAPAIAESDRSEGNVVLVLTGGWLRTTQDGYEQKIGEAGWERTVAGVALWRRVGGRLLITGAPKPDGSDSAAAAMGRVAEALGVPHGRIVIEPASLNTYENLLFSRRLMGPVSGRTWLVTSAVHMPRSVATARAIGLDVIPYPCDFRADERIDWAMFMPTGSAAYAFEADLHELVGMAVYRLKGWN